MNIPNDAQQSKYTVTLFFNGSPVAKNVPLPDDLGRLILNGDAFAIPTPPSLIGAADLTKEQHECLAFIRAFVETSGYTPSYREIGDGVGQAPAQVHRRIHALIDRGFLEKGIAKNRSLLVTAKGMSVKI